MGARNRAHDRQEIVARRARVHELILRKRPVAEIAKELGIPKQQVWRDAHEMREEWKRRALADVGEWIGQQLATLADLEDQAYDRMLVEPDPDRWVKLFDRVLDVAERRARLLALDGSDALRIDPGAFVEFAGEAVLAIRRCVTDPTLQVTLARELERLASRYVSGAPCPSSTERDSAAS